MANKYNTPQVWNKLLNNENYLSDIAPITVDRTKTACKWAQNPKSILNVGSGQGYIEDAFSPILANNKVIWTAMDISTIGLKRIKERYSNINCVNGDILKIPIKIDKFDLIICMEVLEHIQKNKVKTAYSELLRVGNKNAKYIFSVPVYEPVSLFNHPVGHCRKYTLKIISNELSQNGFKIIENKVLYAYGSLYWLKSKIKLFQRFRRPNVVMFLCRKS